MKTEIQIFTDLAWQEKMKYMVLFYQGMIRKTNNSEYIAKFQSKIEEVKWYEENKENRNKMIALYNRIIWAREKTKRRKIEETKYYIEKERLASIKSNTDKENPDEYLAEAITKM